MTHCPRAYVLPTLRRVYNVFMRLCKKCLGPIPDGKRSDAVYCSTACKKSVEYKTYYKPKLIIREHTKCLRCSAPIPDSTKLNARYCSKTCKRRANMSTHNLNRDGLKRSNAGYLPIDPMDWEKLKRRFGYACAYCERKVKLEMDHVIPLSRGGRHALANILPCCRKCNMSKKDKFLAEWRYKKRFGRVE